MVRALNVLRHPVLDRRQKGWHRVATGLAGLLVGGATAWGGLLWQNEQTERLLQTQTRLQAAITQQIQLAEQAQQRQTEARLQAEQSGQWAKVGQHQQAWLALHSGLFTHLQRRGLQLERLQVDGPHITLQGRSTQMAAISAAQNALSHESQSALAMTSLLAEVEQLQFVWEGPWLEGLTPAQPTETMRPRRPGSSP